MQRGKSQAQEVEVMYTAGDRKLIRTPSWRIFTTDRVVRTTDRVVWTTESVN